MSRARCVVVAVIVGLAAPVIAHAEPPQQPMEDYFAGEQRGGYVLLGLGVGGLVSGGLLYGSNSQIARGASYPLLGIGLLHAAAGIFVKVSSGRRVDVFTEQIAKDPQAFVAAERVRMKGVSRQFAVLEVAEITLIAGGLTMATIGWRTDRPRLEGAGIAVAIEMALTLGFDVFAGRRAHRYRAALDVSAGVDPATGAPTAMLVHAGRF